VELVSADVRDRGSRACAVPPRARRPRRWMRADQL